MEETTTPAKKVYSHIYTKQGHAVSGIFRKKRKSYSMHLAFSICLSDKEAKKRKNLIACICTLGTLAFTLSTTPYIDEREEIQTLALFSVD